jgi:hypothetical protein
MAYAHALGAMLPTSADARGRERVSPRGAAWIATGAALLATGIGLASVAIALRVRSNALGSDILVASSPGATGFPAAKWSDVRDDFRAAERMRKTALALGCIGLAAMPVGITLLVLGSDERRTIAGGGVAAVVRF